MKSLKNSKSDVDTIPVTLYKPICPYIIIPLTYIPEQALSEGSFQIYLKVARVTPILKKKCNLRPL